MPRTTSPLTVAELRAAKPGTKPYKLFDGRGLFLLVNPNGSRLWRLKYRQYNKERQASLGQFPAVSLDDARAAAATARAALKAGRNPRHAMQNGDTLADLFAEWLSLQTRRLKKSTRDTAQQRMDTHVLPYLGTKPVTTIEPPDVLAVLRRVESRGNHELAHRLLNRIGQVYQFAISTGRASSDPTAALSGALHPVTTTNRAALTNPKDVAALSRAIYGYNGQPATVAALKILSLTFVRPGELRFAVWGELDTDSDAPTWRIPAQRMKIKREHLVPLSTQALKVLNELRPLTCKSERSYLFPALGRKARPISENTLNVALRAMGFDKQEMTAHGFRATASTLLHEQGFPPEVIELQLAHAQRSQVAAAYNRAARLPERRAMMQAWADYLDVLALTV